MTLRDLIEKKAFAGRVSIDSDDLYLVQRRIFVRKRLRCEFKFGLALSNEVFDTVSFLTPTTLVPAGQLDSEPAYRRVSLLVDVATLAFRSAIQNVISSEREFVHTCDTAAISITTGIGDDSANSPPLASSNLSRAVVS